MLHKVEKLENKKYYFNILSFAIPFIILSIIFIVEKFHPFGNNQILVIDAYHQYYHFILELRGKILSGENLFYSWNMGLGTDFISLMAYYCASPLNILSILIPVKYMSIFFAFLIAFKIGVAGFTFSLYLKSIYKKSDYSIVIFSILYALCGFVAGYYWNIMWLDVFFLFPLVILGVKRIILENRYRMYLLSLALCFFTNYYMSIFVCIFTVIFYFLFSINEKIKLKKFVIKGFKILGISILAAFLFAWILIPAAVALMNVYKTASPFSGKIEIYESFIDVLGNVLAFNYPTVREGLPNLYTGLISIFLTLVYFWSDEIKLREKILTFFTISFLILSTNINILNYIWHGFRYTNMLPYRFTFIFSFVIGIVAYKGYKSLKNFKILEIITIGFISLLIILILGKVRENILLIANLIVFVIYLVIIVINRVSYRKIFEILLLCLVVAEVFANTFIGFETAGNTDYDIFNENREDIELLIKKTKEDNKDNFYRMEMVDRFTFNDPALYQYKGLSLFSSTIDGRVSTFLEHTGIPSYPLGNRYYYTNGTPFTDSIMDIKYLISRKEKLKDNYSMKEIGEQNNIYLYENKNVLPLGFIIENNKFNIGMDLTDNQNNIFKSFTGLEEDFLRKVDRKNIRATDLNIDEVDSGKIYYRLDSDKIEGSMDLEYEIDESGYYYYESEKIENENIGVYHNDNYHTVEYRRDSIVSLGYFEEGDKINIDIPIKSEDKGNYKGVLSILDEENFEKGYNILKNQSASKVEYGSSKVRMEVETNKDGYLFTSIPFNEGWKVFVDGEEREIKPYEEAFVGLELDEGKHIVEFKYISVGFKEGFVISAVTLAFIILLIKRKKI